MEITLLADEIPADLLEYFEPVQPDAKTDVFRINPASFKGAHFATMPEELAEVCIKAGCPESGVVLDPFSGAGTTALVAKKLNRRYVGIELNPAYAEMSRDRINGIPYTLWSLMEVGK